jgi:hypothetical protein
LEYKSKLLRAQQAAVEILSAQLNACEEHMAHILREHVRSDGADEHVLKHKLSLVHLECASLKGRIQYHKDLERSLRGSLDRVSHVLPAVERKIARLKSHSTFAGGAHATAAYEGVEEEDDGGEWADEPEPRGNLITNFFNLFR